MHWRTQCNANWPRRCWEFQHSSGLEPMSPNSLRLTFTTMPLVRINCWKNRYMTRRIVPPATDFFAYRTVVLWLFKLNIKARHEEREFLNANLWSIHLIAFNIDWNCNFFTLHNFFSMLIEQLIDLEKVRTLANSIEIFISHEKEKWLVAARNLQSIKTLLSLELSQNRKSGSMFSSSEPVAARSDCSRFGNALCLCSPVRPAESGSKSLAVDFAL